MHLSAFRETQETDGKLRICSVKVRYLYTISLGLVTEITIALIGQWVGARMPIEALVERLGCGVHGECVVRAWVGGSSRTCEPRGRAPILEQIQLNPCLTSEEIYNILSLGSLLVNAPKAKHRQGLRLVTSVITGTFSRSSVVPG
jgi:hypothetical protein